MPQQTFEITAPNGKTLSITGDHMPSETELHDIFAKAGVETGAAPPAAAAPRNIGAELQAMSRGDHENLLDKAARVINAWGTEGPHRVRQGLEELGLHVFAPIADQYAETNRLRGAHDVIVGSGITALPMVAPGIVRAAVAAPAAAVQTTATALAGGTAGDALARKATAMAGGGEDAQNLAGDVGAVVGGTGAVKAREWTGDQLSQWAQARKVAAAAKANEDQLSAITKALPPTQGAPYSLGDFRRAKPYIEVEKASAPITSVETLRDATDSAISKIEATVKGHVADHADEALSVDVLGAVRRELASNVRGSFVDAGLKELEDLGLDQPLTVDRADRIRSQLNAENKANLAKNSYDQATAMKADPAFAARKAAADALREAIYQHLDTQGIPGVAELRRDEGALIKIRTAAQRQIYGGEKTVGGTGNATLSRRVIARGLKSGATVLGATVGGGGGALVGQEVGQDVADLLVKRNQTRDALIERAFR